MLLSTMILNWENGNICQCYQVRRQAPGEHISIDAILDILEVTYTVLDVFI